MSNHSVTTIRIQGQESTSKWLTYISPVLIITECGIDPYNGFLYKFKGILATQKTAPTNNKGLIRGY